MRGWVRGWLVFGGVAVVLHPLFFVIYRMGVFNTVPRDDYGWFLLWLLGKGGTFPESPYGYRILSMVAAVPFTWMPLIPLTNTPAGLPPEYLKATAALSMVAYLAWVGTGVLAGALARQARLGWAEAVLAGGLALACMFYVQVTAIDPLAVLLIAAGLLLLRRPGWLAGLLAVSVPVNEKVALVLAVWLVLRCVVSVVRPGADRWALLVPAALAVGAVLTYGGVVAVVHLPGNAYQREAGAVPATVVANLVAYASGRGLLLNALPVGVLLGLALVGRPVGVFRRVDWVLVPGLVGVALVLTQFFQAGRIVMHAAPVFVVPAAVGILGWLRGGVGGVSGEE